MRILVRADNPGGKGRVATVLRNQGLLVTTTGANAGTDVPVNGLRIDEVGPITITPAVLGPGPTFTVITPAVVDTAFHANLWIVQPLLTQLKNAFTGTPTGEEDADNDLFDKLKAAGTFAVASVISGIKRAEGYTTATNVTFYLPRKVATHRRVWC